MSSKSNTVIHCIALLRFSDMSEDEFVAKMLLDKLPPAPMPQGPCARKGCDIEMVSGGRKLLQQSSLPVAVNWRSKGKVCWGHASNFF
jgi:hypothetical protein